MKENQQQSALNSAQFQQAQLLFTQACELPNDQRDHWLDQQTSIEPAVIQQVRHLLNISSRLQQDSKHTPISAIDMLELALIESELGKYQLTKSLGEGGMGRVYLARRNDQAFDKDVVIKLMKGFHRKDSTLQRFHFERQVLAKMEHPNIARLLDGGECQDGTPFYVMEYVDGCNLIDYCHQHRLSLNQRLKLFQKICAAVHYAHQNLIIHRDLKPSNILVNQQGEPKLLDFGIAKRLSGDSTPPLTQTAMRPMTPAYSSPEQILGKHLTTASDVYSLGIILFEMLAGQGPFDDYNTDPLRLKAAICEHEAKAPSKLDSNTRRKLRWSGDLDNVVLKALRKEPARRYRSVLQLSDDIQRYLNGHPVSASRNTWLYRGSKLISRHRWATTGILLAVVLLATQQVRVLQQRDQARLNAQQAEQNRDFLIGMFDTLDPNVSQQVDISAKAVLDHGAQQLAGGMIDQPDVKAELMVTLAGLYQEHGLYEKASKLAENAVATGHQLYGTQHPALTNMLNTSADIYINQGYYDKALSTIQNALSIYEHHKDKNPENYIRSMNVLSRIHSGQGEWKVAEGILKENIVRIRLSLNSEPQLLSRTLELLGTTYLSLNEYSLSQQALNESLSICEQHYGKTHTKCAWTNYLLGRLLEHQGLFEQAEQYYRTAIEVMKKTLGPEHPTTAITQSNFGMLLFHSGYFEEAESIVKNSIKLLEQSFGDHVLIIPSLINLSDLYFETDRYQQALPIAMRALNIRKKVTPDNLDRIASLQYSTGGILLRLGQLKSAEQMFSNAINVWADTRGQDNVSVATARASLAAVLVRQKKYTQAEQQTRIALSIYEKNLAPEHWHLAVVQNNLGNIVMQQDRFDEAELLLLPACEHLFKGKSIQSTYTQTCYQRVIELYEKTDRLAEAEPYRQQLNKVDFE